MNQNQDKEQQIPKGIYCYDSRGNCPFWSLRKDKPPQRNGHCSYLNRGDWEIDDTPEGFPASAGSLLWDQCKECGVNEGEDNEDY